MELSRCSFDVVTETGCRIRLFVGIVGSQVSHEISCVLFWLVLLVVNAYDKE